MESNPTEPILQASEPMEQSTSNDVPSTVSQEPEEPVDVITRVEQLLKDAEESRKGYKQQLLKLSSEVNSQKAQRIRMLAKFLDGEEFFEPICRPLLARNCLQIEHFVKHNKKIFADQNENFHESKTRIGDVVEKTLKLESDNVELNKKVAELTNELNASKDTVETLTKTVEQKDEDAKLEAQRHIEEFRIYKEKVANYDDIAIQDYLEQRFPELAGFYTKLFNGQTPIEIHSMYLREKNSVDLLKIEIEILTKKCKSLTQQVKDFKDQKERLFRMIPSKADVEFKALQLKITQLENEKISSDVEHLKQIEEKQQQIDELSVAKSEIQTALKLAESTQVAAETKHRAELDKQTKVIEDLRSELQEAQNKQVTVEDVSEPTAKPTSKTSESCEDSFSVKREFDLLLESYQTRNQELSESNLAYAKIVCHHLDEISFLKTHINDLKIIHETQLSGQLREIEFLESQVNQTNQVKSILNKHRFLLLATHFPLLKTIGKLLVDSESDSELTKESIFKEFCDLREEISKSTHLVIDPDHNELVFKSTPEFDKFIDDSQSKLTEILRVQKQRNLEIENTKQRLDQLFEQNEKLTIPQTANVDYQDEVAQLNRRIKSLQDTLSNSQEEKLKFFKKFAEKSEVQVKSANSWREKYFEQLKSTRTIMAANNDDKNRYLVQKHEKIMDFYDKVIDENNSTVQQFIGDITEELDALKFVLLKITRDESYSAIAELLLVHEKLSKIENLFKLFRYGSMANGAEETALEKEQKEKTDEEARLAAKKEIITLTLNLKKSNAEKNKMTLDLKRVSEEKNKFMAESKRIAEEKNKLSMDLKSSLIQKNKLALDLKGSIVEKNKVEQELKSIKDKNDKGSNESRFQQVAALARKYREENEALKKKIAEFASTPPEIVAAPEPTPTAGPSGVSNQSSSVSSIPSQVKVLPVEKSNVPENVSAVESKDAPSTDAGKKPPISWKNSRNFFGNNTPSTVSSSQASTDPTPQRGSASRKRPIIFAPNEEKPKVEPPAPKVRREITFDLKSPSAPPAPLAPFFSNRPTSPNLTVRGQNRGGRPRRLIRRHPV